MTRPSLDEYLMNLAREAARRTTCIRRGVGCVLADERGRVLSIGYNGVAAGMPHCNEVTGSHYEASVCGDVDILHYAHRCEGFNLPPGRDNCEALHAEQNALVQCPDADRVRTAYVTLSPCKACTKLLLGTGCRRIVFAEPHSDLEPMALWQRAGRTFEQLIQGE